MKPYADERREAAETMALLEAVMEGLTDSQNGALRDLCAAATREFLVWSAKHIPASKDPTKGSSAENMNAASLLRRLFERMGHPEPYQRSTDAPTAPALLMSGTALTCCNAQSCCGLNSLTAKIDDISHC